MFKKISIVNKKSGNEILTGYAFNKQEELEVFNDFIKSIINFDKVIIRIEDKSKDKKLIEEERNFRFEETMNLLGLGYNY